MAHDQQHHAAVSMDCWMQDVFFQVSMMADGTGTRIKQEIDTTSCCSPSPSTSSNPATFLYTPQQSAQPSPQQQQQSHQQQQHQQATNHHINHHNQQQHQQQQQQQQQSTLSTTTNVRLSDHQHHLHIQPSATNIKYHLNPSPCSPHTPNQTHTFMDHQQIELDFKCSPIEVSPSTAAAGIVGTSHPSPGSPDQQFCSSTTTPIGDMCNDLSMDTKEDLVPRRLCLVCGDVASGFHYGVASCEACKAFFKRTIQGNIEYTCPANNECEINKRRRKACQACRFQKCLLMGMLKEGVRLDRVRGGRQKYRRNPAANPYQLMIPQSNSQVAPVSLDDIKMLETLLACEPDLITVDAEATELMCPPVVGSVSSSGNSTGGDDSSEDRKPFKTPVDHNHHHHHNHVAPEDKRYAVQELLTVLSDVYDKELVGVIGWAKQIPGFIELPLNDQMKLLQFTWAEMLTLQLAYRSIPFTGRLMFAKDFWLEEQSAKQCGATELFDHCVHLTQRLERLSARKEEFYLMKALTLANCDVRLDNSTALRKFRDSILNSLNDCVYILRHTSTVAHQQQLLLTLPALRQADTLVRRFWLDVRRDGSISMKKLFVEMLESISTTNNTLPTVV